MKTSELPDWLQLNDPKVFIGSGFPIRPIRPWMAGRTRTETGWLAFQLIQQAEFSKAQGETALFFNSDLSSFLIGPPMLELDGWKPVEFDGYGSVASWKEANL